MPGLGTLMVSFAVFACVSTGLALGYVKTQMDGKDEARKPSANKDTCIEGNFSWDDNKGLAGSLIAFSAVTVILYFMVQLKMIPCQYIDNYTDKFIIVIFNIGIMLVIIAGILSIYYYVSYTDDIPEKPVEGETDIDKMCIPKESDKRKSVFYAGATILSVGGFLVLTAGGWVMFKTISTTGMTLMEEITQSRILAQCPGD